MQPCCHPAASQRVFRSADCRLRQWLAAYVRRLSSSNSPMASLGGSAAVVEAGSTRIASKCPLSGDSSTERSWKEYFTDPSQWWDIRKSKTNPRFPDFKHKITKESLWINGSYNPGWVKDMLKKKESRSKGMHRGKESGGQAWSKSEDRSLVEEYDKASFRSGVQVHAFKAQELREKSGWETISVEEALTSLERMPQLPSVENFTYILHKCRNEKNLAYTKRLLAYMCKSGLEGHRSLGNYLVPMLVQGGSMDDAQQVFNRSVERNVYSWTALIMGYVECGESQHALDVYHKMQEDSVQPSKYTFVAVLKACTGLEDVERGQEIHAEIARKGLERELFVGSALVDMYAKCGLLAKAREGFDKLPARDEVSWTALIAGYAKHGLGEEALSSFEQMQLEGISPDAFTFVCSLKACGSIRAIDKGREIHAEIARKGLERSLFVGSTLIDMYAKCDALAEARKAFDRLPVRNEVSWNALIAGYAEHGLGEEALNCFELMQLEGVSPNAVTFVCSLKACGGIGAIDKGQEIHAEIARKGLETDLFVGSALVDMYAKCGSIGKAQEAFDRLAVRNGVSWNALITGFAEHGLGEEALNCFEQMQLEGVSPDPVTYVCSLKGCGSIGAIEKGQEIHAEIARKGLERDLFVGSTLVDMYAKCGEHAKAWEVFDKLPVRNEVSWNALIAGYAQLGESEIVFRLLVRMRGEGRKPDGVTFLIVLTVCSHTGLVDKGQEYFEAMSKDYGITATIEHHTCMVDLLGRAGQLDKAVAMVKKMPFHPNLRVWHTVLGACRKWGNVKLGRQAFEHAVQLDEKDASAYVLMSNIYADAHMQEDAKKVEAMRVKEQARKKPGKSWWTDVGGTVHSFLAGDTRHSQSTNIYEKLEDLSLKMEEEGYVPDLHWVSRDTSVDAKKDGLCGHSEKLAIACALINTPKGTPIRVVKNFRVCNDCHVATALISKIEQRTILVRDANRFHVFKEGKCACGDYW